jgi:uncharacterized membrane protein required for colicin V production
MGIINITLLAVVCVFSIIGLIVGMVKGFIKSQSWAIEVLIASLIAIGVDAVVQKAITSNALVCGVVSFAIAVVALVVMQILCASLRKGLSKAIEKRKELSDYRQYDEKQDHTEEILAALEENDKKAYAKLTKKKFRSSGGGWTVLDKTLGAVSLFFKGLFLSGVIIAVGLVAVDLTYLASEGGKLYDLFGGVLSSGAWVFCKKSLFDVLTVLMVSICLKCGFKSGVSSAIWGIFVLLMIVGIGWLSWYLSFNVAPFISFAELINTKVSSLTESIATILEKLSISTLVISQYILTVLMFLAMLVVVIIISVFVPRFIDRAREGVAFRTIDGVFGAVILTVFMFAILLVLGAVANSFYEYEFMNVFTSYFENSKIATYVYDQNIINEMGLLVLPVAEWIG